MSSPIEALLSILGSSDNFFLNLNAIDFKFSFSTESNYDKLKHIVHALTFNQSLNFQRKKINHLSIHAAFKYDTRSNESPYIVYSNLTYHSTAEIIKQFFNVINDKPNNFDNVFKRHEDEIYDRSTNYRYTSDIQRTKLKNHDLTSLRLIFYFDSPIYSLNQKKHMLADMEDMITSDATNANEEDDEILQDLDIGENNFFDRYESAKKKAQEKIDKEKEKNAIETTDNNVDDHVVEDNNIANVETVAERVKLNKRSRVFKGKYGKGISEPYIKRLVSDFESYNSQNNNLSNIIQIAARANKSTERIYRNVNQF
jgi:hypothetical protein